LPIVNCRFSIGGGDKASWQSEIKNRKSGDPPATREVVLTSWDRFMSDSRGFANPPLKSETVSVLEKKNGKTE